ncbi:MAG TPA: phosphatase PAP2 family protein [Oleiagrimonas sp.]|nr:phosphatase PAP2 family protein [Oleiagrimonas sp.]
MSLSSNTRSTTWRSRIVPRIKAHQRFKGTAIPAFTAAFFAGYFLLLKFPLFPVTVMPVTAVDRLIGFQPGALILYVSLWLYVSIAPALLDDKRELVSYLWAVTALSLVGMMIFFVWPTATPAPDINWANYPGFEFLKTADTSGNACPSLHVAFAMFSAIWLHLLLRRMGDSGLARCVSWCWCMGIVYSTLATKQHVAVDVLAGAALGVTGAALHLWLLPTARLRQPI